LRGQEVVGLDPALLAAMTPEERAELDRLLVDTAPLWTPLPGPQQRAMESDATVVGFGGAAGGGKGLALDTPLPTPHGWVRMGDVGVGTVLFDPSGNACRVTAVSEISHRPCFRLVFDDGSCVVADDVHRWVTFDAKALAQMTRRDPAWRARRRSKRPSRVKGLKSAKFTEAITAANASRVHISAPVSGEMRDTLSIAATLRTESGRSNHAIPVCGALDTAPAALPLDPYVLGAWLGDGTSANGGITGQDAEIWGRIERAGYRMSHSPSCALSHRILGIMPVLRQMGVLNNKHVPRAYLRGSALQRLALLQGLMDTDGSIAADGGSEFCNTKEHLADAVYELAVSLGIKATKLQGVAKVNGKNCGPMWRIRWTSAVPVFGLSRKLARLPNDTRRTTKMRYVVSCDPVPSVPTRCISVDSPTRQFLCGNAMIPTHNTSLACGLSVTRHQNVAIFRRNGTELSAVVDEIQAILGTRDGFANAPDKVWRFKRTDGRAVRIDFGSFPSPGDERKYQGRPHDLLVFDEAANMPEAAVRFLMGWLRSTDQEQRCRVLMTFNPPTTSEGRWVVKYFAPWLDRRHPRPAADGEIRWFASVGGSEIEVESGVPFEDAESGQMILPQSRTFVRSRIQDNPYLMRTGYMSTLQALPEPLRSQMLYGDFEAGMQDDAFQVIPTKWVEAAMARWKRPDVLPPMDSIGMDVALGGRDRTAMARRHGMWFDEPIAYKGSDCRDAQTVAGYAVAAHRDGAVVHIDVFNVGAGPYAHLMQIGVQAVGVRVNEPADTPTDTTGQLQFANKRAQLWWRMREALDPASNTGIALPPNSELLADLTAPHWSMPGNRLLIEDRYSIKARLGRSIDLGVAYVLALMDTPKAGAARALAGKRNARHAYDPFRKPTR